MSTDPSPVVAGHPLSEEPSEWTPDQIEEMAIRGLEKHDMRFVESCLMLLALKDPSRAEAVMEACRVGLRMAKERNGV